MFQHQGIWLPDGEAHFPEWMTKNGELVDGKGTYQIKKYRLALDYTKRSSYPQPRRVAIDIGAHVGLWAMQMVKNFGFVHCFEPVEKFRECLVRNLEGVPADRYLVYPCALGAASGRALMEIPKMGNGIDSGGTHIGRMAATIDDDPGIVEVRTLDEFDFADVDFIKIDCEGYEHQVVEGAVDTITRCRPVIIVEQKPHKLGPNFGIKGTPAVDALKAMGYRVAREISGDFIMTTHG